MKYCNAKQQYGLNIQSESVYYTEMIFSWKTLKYEQSKV